MKGRAATSGAASPRAAPGEILAVNFDIDNSVVATYYDGGGAIPKMLKFTNFPKRQGVAVVFNSGRLGSQRARTVASSSATASRSSACACAARAGPFPTASSAAATGSSTRLTLIANVGNNHTDFVGDGYESAYVLPNYERELG